MKLATKKFFHNLLAIAVSVCMVCTLTPSAAWASNTANSTWDESSGTASASSDVKAKVINANFAFTSWTEPQNFESKDQFVKAITEGQPLQAIMPEDGLPDNYSLVWRIQEIEDNPSFNDQLGESADNPKYLRKAGKIDKVDGQPDPKGDKIFQRDYTKANSPLVKDEQGKDVAKFEYPSKDASAMLVQPNDLPMENGKKYEFSIVMTDTDGNEASKAIVISLNSNYTELICNVDGNEVISVKGNLYQKFGLGDQWGANTLQATPIPNTDPAFQAMSNAAASKGQEVANPYQLMLINNAVPEGEDPYKGTLEVRLPVPDALKTLDVDAEVNVYIVGADGQPVQKKGVIGWAIDSSGATLVGEDENPITAVVVEIDKTGKLLGSFAIGTPSTGTYTMNTTVDGCGQVSPLGERAVPIGTATTFSVYATTPQSQFDRFILTNTSTGAVRTIARTNLTGYNSLSILPSEYGIKAGDKVELKAMFINMNYGQGLSSTGTSSVTAGLIKEDGAAGNYTVSTMFIKGLTDGNNGALNPKGDKLDKVPVDQGNVRNWIVDRYAGLFIEFLPTDGSYVKSVTINTKPVAIQGNSLLLGTVYENLNIQVTYAKGPETQVFERTVTASIKQSDNGTYPAQISKSDGSVAYQAEYTATAGGQVTIKAQPYRDIYKLDHVYVSTYDSKTQDIVGTTDIVKRVYVSPNNSTYNYPQDEIQLYNVIDDMRVELVYRIISTTAGGSQSTGGSWGWIPGGDDIIVTPGESSQSENAGPSVRRMAKARSAVSTQSATRLADEFQQGSITLSKEGQWARLVIRPQANYQIGDVTINGARINSLLTQRQTASGTCYTLVVYLGQSGTAPSSITEVAGDPAGPDKIFYTNSESTDVAITFNPSVIQMPSYEIITTSVSDFGGGTITPTRNVERGTDVTINFFPDDGYEVSRVWVDDDRIDEMDSEKLANEGLSLTEISLTFKNVQTNHKVHVEFTPSASNTQYDKRYNVVASAGAGGVITPYGTFPVYEGRSQQFVLVPNTGYDISEIRVDGEVRDDLFARDPQNESIVSRNTIELTNIRKDTNVAVTFKPLGASDSASYVITPTKEGQGYVSPMMAANVAAGADIAFTMIPEKGWYVQDIRAIHYNTQGEIVSNVSALSLYDEASWTFHYTDVWDNATINTIFAQCIDGKIPHTNKPQPEQPRDDQKISLGDLEYNTNAQPAGKDPGALLSPSLRDLEIIKGDDGKAVVGQTFTVTVMDGYELDTPIAGTGIKVKVNGEALDSVLGGNEDSSGKVQINQAADGVYTVHVPKELVADGLGFELNTHPKPTSTENVTLHKISLAVEGKGYITPGMRGVDATPEALQVATGKNQSLSFIPESGWKLFAVYLNDNPITVTDNFLTISSIQRDTKVHAVFAKVEEGETAPPTPKTYQVGITIEPGITYSPTEPAPVTVVEGASLTISAYSKDQGYKISATDTTTDASGKRVTVDIPVIGNAVELGDIRENHSIQLKREQVIDVRYQRLTVSCNGGGEASPMGTTLVVNGQARTVTMIPDTGMGVKSVKVSKRDKAIGDIQNADWTEQDVTSSSAIDWSTMTLSLGTITADTRVSIEYCPMTELGGNDPGLSQPEELRYHNITTAVLEGSGTITPASSRVADGGSAQLTIVPSTGYEVDEVTVDGVKASVTNNTLSLPGIGSDKSVAARFKKTDKFDLQNFYTLFLHAKEGADGGTGSISPAGAISVAAGGSQTITIMPDPGCKIASIEAYNNSISNEPISRVTNFTGTSYTFFNVTQDMNIYVTFATGGTGSNVLTHDITTTSSVDGRVSPEGTTKVADGANATFTFVPNAGYKLSYVTIDGRDIDARQIKNNQYIFTDVRVDHTMHAVFVTENTQLDSYATIAISKPQNGIVNPSTSVLVEKGARHQTDLTVTPFYGYRLAKISIRHLIDTNSPTQVVEILDDDFADPNGLWDYIAATHTLRFYDEKVQSDINVVVEFGPNDVVKDDAVVKYIPVHASTTGTNGANGTTILGTGGYVISPAFDRKPDSSELHPQITIAPNDGCMIEKITLTYGQGSKTIVDETGTYEYDKEGNLIASDPNTTTLNVFQQGYVLMDGQKAVQENGITCDVVFRKLTDEEKDRIASGQLIPATYVEIKSTCSGGGQIFPKGRLKAAVGQRLVFQFMPSDGYEVSAVTLNGENVINEVMSNSTRNIIFNIERDAAGNLQNYTIDAAFSFVGNNLTMYDVSATSMPANCVSPGEMTVPEGSDPIVYFFPPDNHKVKHVTVTKYDKKTGVDKEILLDEEDYPLYFYMVGRISSDVKVYVEYARAGDNEATWNVQPVDVSADCPGRDDSFKVWPESAKVPAGSPQTFFFKAAPGYLADYVTFNGIATTLIDNPSSFTVTPSTAPDAENRLSVYFREATARDKQFVTLTPQIAEGSHATISPKNINAEVGKSISFYVSPDKGYTIDTVTVDGWPVDVKPALAAGATADPGKEYDMYIVTIDDVHADDEIIVTTKTATQVPEVVPKHTMTITGENVFYSPMGTIQVPGGGKQTISVTPLAGYYLDSVTVVEKGRGPNGEDVESDYTDHLIANELTVTMGNYDMDVNIRYVAVGSEISKPTPAYITIGSTTVEGTNENVNAIISMKQRADGTLEPLEVNSQRELLNEDGTPYEFQRGSLLTFYTAVQDNPKLVLSKAYYNGAELNVPELTNMISNMKINASGVLDLVFRELKPGEVLVNVQTFNVKFELGADSVGHGTLSLTEVSVPIGTPTAACKINLEDGWMIESIVENRYAKNGEQLGAKDVEVDARRYKNETYSCTPMADTVVTINLVQCALVEVKWDHSLGFVSPNPATDYLKLPVEDTKSDFLFIVAPFEDCYVKSFTVTHENGDSYDLYYDLTQDAAVREYLEAGGYDVKDFDEGEGVVRPEGENNGGSGEDSSSASTFSLFGTRAYAAEGDVTSSMRPIDANGFIPPVGTKLQNVYGVSAALDESKSTVDVGLYTTRDIPQGQFTITPKVNGSGGRIEPSTAQIVDAGGTQSFNLIADNGYTVKRVLVDGSPIVGGQLGSNGTSYTFFNVDRNHTIEVEFGPISSSDSSRLLRVASSLAKTGDLTGPAVGALLIVAALGLMVTAVSYIRRQQRRRRRMQRRA